MTRISWMKDIKLWMTRLGTLSMGIRLF